MIYRAVRRIAVGEQFIEPGTVGAMERLGGHAKAVLLARGALAEVAPPPLSVLPRWRVRAKALGKLGVLDAVQLIEGDADGLGKALGVSAAAVVAWQAEAMEWLKGPPLPVEQR